MIAEILYTFHKFEMLWWQYTSNRLMLYVTCS